MSFYQLEKLKLKPADIAQLPEAEQIQKIRLQWMSLCIQTNDEHAVDEYTRAYHDLISPYDFSSSDIHRYYERNFIAVPHFYFNLLQREQIEKSYQELLSEFCRLETETDKQNFAQRHSAFLNLAQSLKGQRKEFEEFFAGYLHIMNRRFTLVYRIYYQWRLLMIRLFAIEGLDDFQYRNALATGRLKPILARDKLFSPVKLLVALVNSLLIAITISLNYVLDLHFTLRIAFSCFLFHPVAIVLIQLPKIARILEMLACPNNQILRPISAYSKLSPQTVAALLGLTVAVTLYGVMYTALLASLTTLLPYLQLLALAYFLYSIGKLCAPFFQQSLVNGLSFAVMFGLSFTLMTAIRIYIANTLGVSTIVTLSNDNFKQGMNILSLFSIATAVTTTQNPLTQIQMLPNAHQPVSDNIQEVVRTRYNKANLSHQFFNTPKEAEAIRPTEANNYSHCFSW